MLVNFIIEFKSRIASQFFDVRAGRVRSVYHSREASSSRIARGRRAYACSQFFEKALMLAAPFLTACLLTSHSTLIDAEDPMIFLYLG